MGAEAHRFPRSEERGDSVPLKIVNLPRFLELKLASGMTARHRLQDLADVLRLIETTHLALELGDELDPFVREKYAELWRDAQHEEDAAKVGGTGERAA